MHLRSAVEAQPEPWHYEGLGPVLSQVFRRYRGVVRCIALLSQKKMPRSLSGYRMSYKSEEQWLPEKNLRIQKV